MKSNSKERILTLNCAEGEEVSKKQHACFVQNLITDALRPKPLIIWRRDPKAKAGTSAYYTNGLAEGTIITLRWFIDKSGVEFTYSRHGKRIYTAIETDGNISCDMHLAALLHRVICVVTVAEATQKKESLADAMDSVRPKAPEPERYHLTVGDVFRTIDADELVAMILDQPTMLGIGIAKTGSCPEHRRIEALIRATVSYIQNVRRKENGILMQAFGLKSLQNGRICGHLVTSPLAQIANAYVKLDDKHYGGLNPNQRNLKFARDIVVNLLAGV